MLLAVALAAGVVAAGCGGDDDDGDGEALTKVEFISQADAICAEGDREIDQAGREAFGDQRPSEQEIEQFATDTVAPNIQNQIDGIRALTPPEGDEQQVAEILDAAQNGIDEIEQDPSLLNQGPDAGGAFTEANNLATEYGLTDCGG
jgi:hypothetical protein